MVTPYEQELHETIKELDSEIWSLVDWVEEENVKVSKETSQFLNSIQQAIITLRQSRQDD